MQLHESSRLQLNLAIRQLEHAADEIGAVAFSVNLETLTDEQKALVAYYERVAASLQETLQELRVMASRRKF